jgi:hypothetical protein
MQPVATQRPNLLPLPYVLILKPELIKKPVCRSSWYEYTPRRRPPAHARGAARHFAPSLNSYPSVLLPPQAYAAFGSCGLVVPATSPFVAPSATSAAGNCP